MVKPVLKYPELDLLVIEARRRDVERNNINPVLEILNDLLTPVNAKQYFEKVELCVSGYDNDPKELCEIPEVRKYMSDLDSQFPYWFYFITKLSLSLSFITFSLCQFEKNEAGEIHLDPSVLIRFMERHFKAVNELENLGLLDEAENQWLSKKVYSYYTTPKHRG